MEVINKTGMAPVILLVLKSCKRTGHPGSAPVIPAPGRTGHPPAKREIEKKSGSPG